MSSAVGKLLSVSEASTFLGVSAASVRSWSNSGYLRAYRTPGGQRRYAIEELEEFLSSLREPVIWRRTPSIESKA
jgi:excisionase family DNA binding protein